MSTIIIIRPAIFAAHAATGATRIEALLPLAFGPRGSAEAEATRATLRRDGWQVECRDGQSCMSRP